MLTTSYSYPHNKGLLHEEGSVKCLERGVLRVQPHFGPCSLTSGGIWEGGKKRQSFCEQIPRDGEGQGSLVCCGPWGRRVGHWVREQWQQVQPLRPACFLYTKGMPRTASTLNAAKEGALLSSQCRRWMLCWERNRFRHWAPAPRPTPASQHSTATANIQGPVCLSNSHLKKKKATFYLLKLLHVYYRTSNCPVIKLLCKLSIWENYGKRKFDLSKTPQNWEKTPVPELETRLSLLRLTLLNLSPTSPRAGLQALGQELSQGRRTLQRWPSDNNGPPGSQGPLVFELGEAPMLMLSHGQGQYRGSWIPEEPGSLGGLPEGRRGKGKAKLSATCNCIGSKATHCMAEPSRRWADWGWNWPIFWSGLSSLPFHCKAFQPRLTAPIISHYYLV